MPCSSVAAVARQESIGNLPDTERKSGENECNWDGIKVFQLELYLIWKYTNGAMSIPTVASEDLFMLEKNLNRRLESNRDLCRIFNIITLIWIILLYFTWLHCYQFKYYKMQLNTWTSDRVNGGILPVMMIIISFQNDHQPDIKCSEHSFIQDNVILANFCDEIVFVTAKQFIRKYTKYRLK